MSDPSKDTMEFLPDPKKHLIVSLGKSVVRIVGYTLLFFTHNDYCIYAGVVLLLAEIIGIIEEVV